MVSFVLGRASLGFHEFYELLLSHVETRTICIGRCPSSLASSCLPFFYYGLELHKRNFAIIVSATHI
jgi:hypothetical protein